MKQKKEKTRVPIADNHQSLGTMADLLVQAGLTPSINLNAPVPAPKCNEGSTAETPVTIAVNRIRIRCERKNRGGKTVTLVEGLHLDEPGLASLLRRIKAGLGCGGTIEDGVLILQGEIVERTRRWFEKNPSA